MRFFLWPSASMRGTYLAHIFLYPRCLLKISQRRGWEIWGNFSCSSSRVERLSCRICSSVCFYKSSVMRDGRLNRSSSWTFVLPSLNIRHHFLTLNSFITPSPYTAVRCLWMSIARTFCTFIKQITDRTSQSAGLLIFLFILNTHWSCLNDEIGSKLTWNKANGRLTLSDLESAQSVDLRERYVQTVFTFWTTLVLVFCIVLFFCFLLLMTH
jgi:hypothetical protein